MKRVVMIRHGESEANREQTFAGWLDVALTEFGLTQTREAGRILKDEGFQFDIAYASYLQRSIASIWQLLEEMSLLWIPVECHWELNERHYGAFQGLSKVQVIEQLGWQKVHMIRRGYETPPPLNSKDPYHSRQDGRYDVLGNNIPLSESLQDVEDRVAPFWDTVIAPHVKDGKQVILSMHGNSIRALLKHIAHIPKDQITGIEIPTGTPLVIEFDDNMSFSKRYFLGKKSLSTDTSELMDTLHIDAPSNE